MGTDNTVEVKVIASTTGLETAMQNAASHVQQASKQMEAGIQHLQSTSTGVFAQLKQNLSQFVAHHQEELAHAGSQLGGFQASIISAFAGAAVTGAILELGSKLSEAIAHFAEFGNQLEKTAQKVGVSVESLSALKYAAELSDVSFESLSQGMKKLAKNASGADEGAGAAANAFRLLGIETHNTAGGLRPTEQLLGDIADAFSHSADSADKTAIAIQLFGRAGADLIPFLNKGRTGIAELTAEATRLGVTMTGEDAKAGEEFADELKRINAAMAGVWNTIGKQLLPIMLELAKSIEQGLQQGGLLNGVFTTMTVTVKGIISVFEAMAFNIRSVAEGLAGLIDLLGKGLVGAYQAAKAALTGNFGEAKAIVTDTATAMAQSFHLSADRIQQDAAHTGATLDAMWGKTKKQSATSGATGTAVADVIASAKAREQAERELAASQERLGKQIVSASLIDHKIRTEAAAQAAHDIGATEHRLGQDIVNDVIATAKAKQKADAEEAASQERLGKQIVETSKIQVKLRVEAEAAAAHDIAATQKRLGQDIVNETTRHEAEMLAAMELVAKEQAQLDADDEEHAINARLARVAQREQEAKDIMAVQERLGKDIVAEAVKETKDREAAQQAFNAQVSALMKPLTTASDQMVIGMMRGTQTWQQASQRAVQNVLASYANMMVNVGVQWVETQLDMTAVQLLESTKRIAMEAVTAAQTKATQAATGVMEVLSLAAVGSAAAGASTAAIPIVGPDLAPGAMTTMFGEIAAMAPLATAAGGWDVPRDSLAMVHKQEMILPADLSNRVRGMTDQSGGQGDIHVHINAIDAKSFAVALKSQESTLSRMLQDKLRMRSW
jgi:hypothetical protein